MATYWISFHIHDDAAYADRYDALHETIADVADGAWWDETTSFIIFDSEGSAVFIANKIAMAIDQRVDTVLLGQTDFKTLRVIGMKREFSTLQRLVPFVK